MKKVKWLLFLLLATGLSFMTYSCGKSSEAGPVQIFRNTDSIRLAWNAVTTDVNGDPTYIDHYNVYYRARGSTTWTFLGEAPDIQDPWYEIWHSDIGDGYWEFAVVAVDVNGNESGYHTSLDQNANPAGGWYLLWVVNPDNIPPTNPTGLRIL